jgi:hypothetical protein
MKKLSTPRTGKGDSRLKMLTRPLINRHDASAYRAHYCIRDPKDTTGGRLDYERSILRNGESVWTNQVDVINYSNKWADELPLPNNLLKL